MRFSVVAFLCMIVSVANGAAVESRGDKIELCAAVTSNKFDTIQVIGCSTGQCDIEADATLNIDPIPFDISFGVGVSSLLRRSECEKFII